MPDVSGARLTTNIASDQFAIDIGKRINLLEPSVQPLAVWTNAAGRRSTISKTFKWVTDKSKARYDAINNGAGYTNSATSIVVDTGARFAVYDTVLNTRTGELMRVTAVSTNTLTVVRGIGTAGTGVAMLDNDELLIVASAQPEFDLSKAPKSDNPVTLSNYTQIFRESIEESGTLQASGFQLTPADWPHQIRKAGIEHAKDIEYSGLFGKKDTATVSGKELRTTGGILPQIVTNQTDAGGALTEDELNAFMLKVMRYGSSKKLFIASGIVVGALNKFPASKQITRNDEKTYGMDVTNYTSPFGALKMVYHRLLEGTKYSGYGIAVDLDEVEWRYLANDEVSRDTKVLPNRQEPDRDGRRSEYLTEGGWQWGSEETHGVLTGVTS